MTNTILEGNGDAWIMPMAKHYNVNDTVGYFCENESFDMKGNSTITCKYGGEWSEVPQCISKSSKSFLFIILIGFVFLNVSPLVIILIVKIKRKQSELQLLTRDKEYDAFFVMMRLMLILHTVQFLLN